MSRPTSRRDGPRTLLVPVMTWPSATPLEMTDAQSRQTHETPPSPLLARPPRMVWRCGLRKLLAFKGPTRRLLPHPESGRILRRPAQPPLLPPQPLLLSTDSTTQRTRLLPSLKRLREALRKIASACLEFLVFFGAAFQDTGFVCDANAVVANPGEDVASRFGREHLGSKHSRHLSRENLDEQRRDMSRGIGYWGNKPSLLADLIKRRKHAVTSYQ